MKWMAMSQLSDIILAGQRNREFLKQERQRIIKQQQTDYDDEEEEDD